MQNAKMTLSNWDRINIEDIEKKTHTAWRTLQCQNRRQRQYGKNIDKIK